jgi:hypothetical protein
MNESIIYTYKTPQYNIYTSDTNQKSWISKSIESARKLNYKIELYTNDSNFAKGLDIDEVHFIDDEYELWDSFKIYVLENRIDSNYFLSDNDVIFKKRLPLDNSIDIYFDGTEIHNWDWAYKTTMNYLKDNSVFDEIPFWKYDKIPVFNVGILKINNPKLRDDYIFYWKKLHSISKPYFGIVDKTFLTAIITQYLLTLLSEKDNYNSIHFTRNGKWNDSNNDFYNHYCGYLKIKNPPILNII